MIKVKVDGAVIEEFEIRGDYRTIVTEFCAIMQNFYNALSEVDEEAAENFKEFLEENMDEWVLITDKEFNAKREETTQKLEEIRDTLEKVKKMLLS